MNPQNRRHFLATLGAGLCVSAPGVALAQEFPNKPIRMLVGFAPGGPTDILARIVATALTKAIGQSVVVDNRPGAAGALAAQTLAKSEADGYTVMFAGDGQLTLLPQLSANAGYRTLRDFTTIRTVAGQSNVLLVNKATGLTDLQTLIRQAKTRPGKISFGSAGNGTPSHLVGALLENAAGIELLHVPYRGAGPAMTDFLGGRLDLMFVGMPVAVQHAQNEKFAVLAVTGAKRSARLPAVPTFTELGMKGLGEETDVWWALAAPIGTPAAVQARLDAALRVAMDDPMLKQAFVTQGVDRLDRDAAATARRIEGDQARWSELIKAGKVSNE
ncbi:Bug family tripartite tricarboxylate transporter substrate binding protein [Ottowia thiooxydans]|uniref:Bug family tripartite tricarboxylate transporter substrate binding protein n=1 Tax=Ottowia thiooxydans TaxID=219182 RepID=UPI000407D65F|nr:tripartite tricarboxylate transporter substrate binding protein [Ottowia thiooxydans]